MMTCRECAELLLEYLEGALDTEQAQRLQRHLADCPPCVIFVETYRLTITMTRKLPCGELPPDVARRLWEAMQRCQDQPEA
jgi:anti-sigma factor RsiW